MTRNDEHEMLYALPARPNRWWRRGLLVGVPVLLGLILLLILWNTFFYYVPPGKMLVVIAKMGSDLPPGQVLADRGQKGIQREVLGEGWHFIMPIIYTTELEDNVVIEPGELGIVTALDGKPLPEGRILAEEGPEGILDKNGERGIRRQVLPPGSYRLNPYGFKVEKEKVIRIEAGFVGVKRRKLGKDGPTQFAENDDQKGILKNDILQPGIYYINPREYEVIPCDVGVYQLTYHYTRNEGELNTAITFPGKDGNVISLDCTIEYEILPEDWPALVAKYGKLQNIEQIVVDQHARKICRDRGLNYGAQDFLEGDKREKFQADFRAELDKVCKDDNVVVRSAFIRTIVIPETFLEQKRLEQLAVETQKTSKELTETALSEAEVQKAEQMIELKVAEVKAETARMVAKIERDTENVRVQIEADIEKLKAEYGKKKAELEGERDKVMGEAKAKVVEMKKTAESSLYKMKMDVFGKDGEAYLRYSMAQELNPNIRIRLFQSGPGTLWTNMGDKSMNLMLPLPAAEKKAEEVKMSDQTNDKKP